MSADEAKPPPHLSHEEVCVIKTSLALVVARHRYEEEKKQQEKEDAAGAEAASKKNQPQQGDLLSASFLDATTNKRRRTGFVDWSHLNHMMHVAKEQSKATGGEAEYRFHATISHIASRIDPLLTSNDSKVLGDTETWLISYLVALDQQAARVLEEIMLKLPRPSLLCEMLVPSLASIITARLLGNALELDDDDEEEVPVVAESHALLSLWNRSLTLSSDDTIQECVEELSDFSVVENPAALYQKYLAYPDDDAATLLLLHLGVTRTLEQLCRDDWSS